MNNEQIRTIQRIGLAVLETIQEAGELGAPGGVLYATLMTQGCTLNQFQTLMAPLERQGYVAHEADCYTITPQGETFIGKLRTVLGCTPPATTASPAAFAHRP